MSESRWTNKPAPDQLARLLEILFGQKSEPKAARGA